MRNPEIVNAETGNIDRAHVCLPAYSTDELKLSTGYELNHCQKTFTLHTVVTNTALLITFSG